MSEPFLGEIRRVSFNFAPRGWALCNGQLLAINQNQALFSLLGTTYGGNGQTTFALPDLRGRMAIHEGLGFVPGQQGGEADHTLTVAEMAAHSHGAAASSAGGSVVDPAGAYWAKGKRDAYGAGDGVAMHPSTVAATGAGQPHENRAPYLVVNHIIALFGIFPARN